VQCECHNGKYSGIAKITSIDRNWDDNFVFPRKPWFLVSISRVGKCPFWSPLRTPLITPDTASSCARNSCQKRYSNCVYLRVIVYKRSDTSLYSTKRWSRISSLREFRWFALKYFFGLYFKYFINLKTFRLGDIVPISPLASHLVAIVFWLRVTDSAGICDWGKFMWTPIL